MGNIESIILIDGELIVVTFNANTDRRIMKGTQNYKILQAWGEEERLPGLINLIIAATKYAHIICLQELSREQCAKIKKIC